MPQTLTNGIKTPVNSDAYNLTADLATMGDSAKVVIGVTSTAHRDGLPKYQGLTVSRLDIPGAPLQTWDGTRWPYNDTPWTYMPLVQGFQHETGSSWLGLRYRVKNEWFMVSGAVNRDTPWPAGMVVALVPLAYRVDGRVQGVNCQFAVGDGNLVLTAAGSIAASMSIMWPLN